MTYEYFTTKINILHNLRKYELKIKACGENAMSTNLKLQTHTHTLFFPTIVEVSLLVHHECLDFRAVISAEGKGPGVLRPELVFPGASEINCVHQGQTGHAAEVIG